MFSLKKTAFTMLILSSTTLFAGTMGAACVPGEVTTPCEGNSWEVGGYALYLKPSYNGDADLYNFSGSFLDDGVYVQHTLKQAWNWGFKLEGAYHFATGNDFNVNWLHWNETNRELLHVVQTSNPFDRFTSITIKPELDAVNFELGQKIDLNGYKSIRFHGGLQYAHVQRSSRFALSGTITQRFDDSTGELLLVPIIEPIASISTHNFKFNGVGPRIGTDMSYDWSNAFGVYANGAMALIVGRTKSLSGDIGPTRRSLEFEGYTVIIPTFDIKAGAKYTYETIYGRATLDAGYMVINYFQPLGGGIYGRADFGLQGPYIGIKWLG